MIAIDTRLTGYPEAMQRDERLRLVESGLPLGSDSRFPEFLFNANGGCQCRCMSISLPLARTLTRKRSIVRVLFGITTLFYLLDALGAPITLS